MVSNRGKTRRMRIAITDEETGEDVMIATGVEALVLLLSPDAEGGRAFRHVLIGDAAVGAELLFDILHDLTDKVRRGTMLDLSDAIDDRLLLDVTEGLTQH
jgi:hypothetical protein